MPVSRWASSTRSSAVKRDEVTVLHRPQTADLLRKTALDAPPTRDFAGALRRADGTLAVIAEIKRRSPSKGELAPDLDPAVDRQGATKPAARRRSSVLTDLPFFGGTVEDLQAAREATALPVLRKDFTIDAVQVFETRAHRCRRDPADRRRAARRRAARRPPRRSPRTSGSRCSSRPTTSAEVERALASARGSSASTAATSRRSTRTSASPSGCRSLLPPETVRSPRARCAVGDAQRMAAAGFDAVLVGEALVRSADAAALVGEMAAVPVRRPLPTP